MAKEDQMILLEYRGRNNSRGRVIAAGALNFLKRNWAHADLLCAILAGCLLTAAIVVLVLIPIILALVSRQYTNDTCRFLRSIFNDGNKKSTSVYFIKHENRTWTNKELCHIETAARRFAEYNIFMINLLMEEKENFENESKWDAKLVDELLDNYVYLKQRNTILLYNANDSDTEMRYRLSRIPNVINVEIGVEKFFSGSFMSDRLKNLNIENIELAAKFQIIWNSPGIALDPLAVNQLKSLEEYYDSTVADPTAIIQLENDLQASKVPCQSFIGLVINELVKSTFADRQIAVEHALEDFCPSIAECPGVRIIKSISKKPQNFTTCPIVHPVANTDSKINSETVAQATM